MLTIQHSGPDGEITTTFEYDGIQRLVRALQQGRAIAIDDNQEKLFATMGCSLITVTGRDNIQG